ncbi:MAG: ATP-binding cassette domain-containing protein [Idiomarina sp.]|nr:ATP-binding cassette domain-containing protein [Idiomarina sp.]
MRNTESLTAEQRRQARDFLQSLSVEVGSSLGWVKLLAALVSLATVGVMIALALLLAGVVQGDALEAQGQRFFVLCGAIGVRVLFVWLHERAAERLTLEIQTTATEQLLTHWQADMQHSVTAADAIKLTTPLDALWPYFTRYLPQLWLSMITPLVILALVFRLDWIAGLFLLLAAPLIPTFMILVGFAAERLNTQHFQELRQVSRLLTNRISALPLLKGLDRAEDAQAEVATTSEQMRLLSMKTLRVAFLSSAVLEFFAALAIAAVAIYVGFALLGFYTSGPGGELTFLVGITILLLAPEYFQPLRTLSQFYHERASALGAAALLLNPTSVDASKERTVLAVADREVMADKHYEPVHESVSNSVSKSIRAGLMVKSLKIGYQQPLLNPLSFVVEPGQILALQGPSGVGKTTLLRTLAGIIPPLAGMCRLNNLPVTRGNAAYLAQTPLVIEGSLATNLRLAAPHATTEQMLQALAAVGLNDWLEGLPHKLSTILKAQGANISGGEARRIAMARLLLAAPKLVLLDEPTASLDEDVATSVRRTIESLRHTDRIVVVASHDPALIALADTQLKLERIDVD